MHHSDTPTGDTVEGPVDTKLTAQLVLELIRTASQVADEVRVMREEIQRSAEERRRLAAEVRCLADNVKKFQTEFEPYLRRAVASENVWRDRRNQVMVHLLKWGAVGAVGALLVPWERLFRMLWP